MLLDSLINDSPDISIDAYLDNPKTNSVGKQKEKISFNLKYLPHNRQSKESERKISDFTNQLESFSNLGNNLNFGSSLTDIAIFPLRVMLENKFNFNDEINDRARIKRIKLNYNKLISSNTCWQITVRIHQLSGY